MFSINKPDGQNYFAISVLGTIVYVSSYGQTMAVRLGRNLYYNSNISRGSAEHNELTALGQNIFDANSKPETEYQLQTMFCRGIGGYKIKLPGA